MQNTPSLQSLAALLWPEVVAPDRVMSMVQIKLIWVFTLNWIVWNKNSVLLLYSHIIHMELYTYTRKIITTAQERRHATQSFRKIYLSLYLNGLCVRESWGPNRTATYWPPTLMAISVSFLFSRVAQPEARRPSFLVGADFLYHILSPNTVISKTNWLPVFTKLYNSSIAHSISAHNWPSECGTCAVFGMACFIVIARK